MLTYTKNVSLLNYIHYISLLVRLPNVFFISDIHWKDVLYPVASPEPRLTAVPRIHTYPPSISTVCATTICSAKLEHKRAAPSRSITYSYCTSIIVLISWP